MNKVFSVTAVSILVFSFMFLGMTDLQAATKIGYADMEKALQSTRAGKRAKKKVQKEVDKRKKVLDKQRREILKLEGELKKQNLVLSAESKKRKRRDYLKKVEQLRTLIGKSQQEMQQLEQKIAAPILKKMNAILQKLSKEKGYDLVLTKNALLYASDADDLTKALVKRFNKEYKR